MYKRQFQDYLSLISPWATHWLAAVLMVAWLVRRAQGPLHAERMVTAAVPVVGLVGAVLLALVVHPNGVEGLVVAAKYVELAIVMLVLADVLCGPLTPRRAARYYVLACTAASVCGIITAAATDRHRVVGPIASADTLAFFLIAALPLAGTVRTRHDQPMWRAWACFGVLLLAMVGTQSRPAYVALVAMILIAVLTGLLAVRHAGPLLAVAVSAVALVIAVVPLSVGQALTDPQRYSETNIVQRNDSRSAALEMTAASPAVGLGPAAFGLFHHDFRHSDADPDGRDVDASYSTVLEASAELGLLGVLALYAAWLLPAVAARRRWLRDRRRLTAGTLLAFDGLLLVAVLESQQYVLPLWFMAAMLFAQGRPIRPGLSLFGGDWLVRPSGQVMVRS